MKNRLLQGLLATAATVSLAACGGGGGGGAPAPSPGTAGGSSEGFIAFIASFEDGMFDDDEPFDLSDFEAPNDETESDLPAPTPVDD